MRDSSISAASCVCCSTFHPDLPVCGQPACNSNTPPWMVDLLVVYILLYCVLNVSLDSRNDHTNHVLFIYDDDHCYVNYCLFLNAGDIYTRILQRWIQNVMCSFFMLPHIVNEMINILYKSYTCTSGYLFTKCSCLRRVCFCMY
jgi:hypothetical protein